MRKILLLSAILLTLTGCKKETPGLDIVFVQNIDPDEKNTCKYVQSVNGKTINESRINGNKIVLIDVTGQTRDIRIECGKIVKETDEETGETRSVINYTDLDTKEVYKLYMSEEENEEQKIEEKIPEIVEENSEIGDEIEEENGEQTGEGAEEKTDNTVNNNPPKEVNDPSIQENNTSPVQEEKPVSPPKEEEPVREPEPTPAPPAVKDPYKFYLRGVPDAGEAATQASKGCFDLGYSSASISAISQEDWEVLCE